MNSLQRILATSAPSSVVLIRLLVGTIFLSEGIQKFLFASDLGVGRFVKIGIPAPQVMAPFCWYSRDRLWHFDHSWPSNKIRRQFH
jgi:putative oxidoreductase